jgi:hypothetical protein
MELAPSARAIPRLAILVQSLLWPALERPQKDSFVLASIESTKDTSLCLLQQPNSVLEPALYGYILANKLPSIPVPTEL